MSTRTRIINCFTTAAPDPSQRPLLLLDLTLWHKWRQQRDTLPHGWGTVIEAARALGTPVWAPFRPWRLEHDGVTVTTEQTASQRDVVYQVGSRTLLARWTLGPDGDWWQTEYPVRTPEDLQAAVEIAAARRYVVDSAGLADWKAAVGDDGVVPLELPMRPYSDLFHAMVGWSEGVMLTMGAGKPLVDQIVAGLESALARLAEEVAELDGDLLLAPDNLDGQYISPRAFKEHLAPSYAATAALGRRCDKPLVVHVGGPAGRLIPLLQQAGVDGIEGIAGPPQGDATLAEARAAAGPNVTLWGGVPQDLLISEHDEEAFEGSVRTAIAEAEADAGRRVVVGVADRVPVNAELSRLRRLVEMAA